MSSLPILAADPHRKNRVRYNEIALGSLVGEYDQSGNLIQETVWLNDIPVALLISNGTGWDVHVLHPHRPSYTHPEKSAGRATMPLFGDGTAMCSAIASAFALLGCLLLIGFQQPESIFKLAPESRLPRWFVLPPGISRSDISITMSYYVTSSGRSAKFTMSDAQSHKLSEVSGELKWLNPVSLKNSSSESSSGYPSYEIVTVGGVTEVVEHRRMEPIFYITDDSSILKKLGVDK